MKSNEEYRKIVADLRTINATNLERQASNAIEELLEAIERQTSIVRVETPLGAIIARPSDYGPEGQGFESLTACQKPPKITIFGGF